MATSKYIEMKIPIQTQKELMSYFLEHREILAKKFREYTIEALDKAKEILLGSKDSDYNAAWIEMLDYFLPFPSLFTWQMCRLKQLRSTSLLFSGNKEHNESKQDTCVDEINYRAMLYAAQKLENELGISFEIKIKTREKNLRENTEDKSWNTY